MIEDILSKRQQTKGYHPLRIPDKKLAENLISKTFKLTASKQNLMPYKVHVLGPDKKELKKEFFKIVRHQKGGSYNMNVEQAPYCLIFTIRLVTNPDTIIYERIKKGHSYEVCDPNKYHKQKSGASLEVGMFAKVLTSLVLEQGMDVSYTGCFPDYESNENLYKNLSFIDDLVLFSMQFGYRFSDYAFTKEKEKKPSIDEVINWV